MARHDGHVTVSHAYHKQWSFFAATQQRSVPAIPGDASQRAGVPFTCWQVSARDFSHSSAESASKMLVERAPHEDYRVSCKARGFV